jgi:RNA polymerase sigma factor (sigma-70 family)
MKVVANNINSGFAGAELIERLRSSDIDAMEIIYNDHKKSAISHMRKFNNDEEILNDIYQDTMVAIFKKSLEPGFVLTCDLQGYINRICRNLLLNRINIEKKQREIEDGSYILKKSRNNPEDTEQYNEARISARPNINNGIIEEEEDVININIENVSLFNKVWNQMKNLSEKCFEIINRTFLLNENNETVSEELGFKDKVNFKSKKAKCLKQLKTEALKLKIHS